MLLALDLARAPLKYQGLAPWEILVSEAQERMSLAVPPENIDEFLAMARRFGVEATVLGEFTDDGIAAIVLVAFVVVHVAMVGASGLWNNLRSMVTGDPFCTSKVRSMVRSSALTAVTGLMFA